MAGRRCVVTGLGVVAPNGLDAETFWSNCLSAKSGVSRISYFDVDDYASQIAGEVSDFKPEDHFDKKEIRRSDPVQLLALYAAEMALKDSAIDLDSVDHERCGCIIGSGIGGIRTFEAQHSLLEQKGHSKVSPFFIPMMISDMCAGAVALKYNLKGPNYATVSACSSSAHAIANSFRSIVYGEADVFVAGGAESAITPLALAGFCSARALSTRNDEPERASRPFDSGRDGFVIGEGAAALILEEYEHARKRGARIYAEIAGAGQSCDAYHVTAPSLNGEGAARAMIAAIKDGNIEPDQVSYINTHGTSTGLGDVAEVTAIKSVFGGHAKKIPINSTKSMIGHLLGAAGAVETSVCVLSIRDGVVHQTINLDDPDPECDLDFVSEGKRSVNVEYALTNSFGFGGHNVSLLLKSLEDGKA
ncbi:MAG: beta-ketoacyl-ACP synthase II [Candidatus Zixiibacteriota bacterium]